jgi:hypothetical protein
LHSLFGRRNVTFILTPAIEYSKIPEQPDMMHDHGDIDMVPELDEE